MRTNYFNNLSKEEQLAQLAACRLMLPEEFREGTNALKNKNIVILGCGSQGLNQGLNMRDSGLSISYALREGAIQEKRPSFKNATENGFKVDTFDKLIPKADLVINLTPDKQHTPVMNIVQPLMKKNAVLSYSHGFNIVEEGMRLRKDITVIMVAPKCPGTEVREEYRRGFGVPTLIAVHPGNDPLGIGLEWAKAYAYATGGHRAGVLESSFAAEVKSDLMGEQTILCGVLQTVSILSFEKMISEGVEASNAARLVQFGWENITEALKTGGITGMMNRLSRVSRVRAYHISEELKEIMRPLFRKHMEDILSGSFSVRMMRDWDNNDEELLEWRAATGKTAFEKTEASAEELPEQEYFDKCLLMAAFVKSGW